MPLVPLHRHRRVVSVLLAVSCLVAIAGCGSSSSHHESGVRPGEQGLRFASCMRSHGVPNFPDPSAGGGFDIASTINARSPAYSGPPDVHQPAAWSHRPPHAVRSLSSAAGRRDEMHAHARHQRDRPDVQRPLHHARRPRSEHDAVASVQARRTGMPLPRSQEFSSVAGGPRHHSPRCAWTQRPRPKRELIWRQRLSRGQAEVSP